MRPTEAHLNRIEDCMSIRRPSTRRPRVDRTDRAENAAGAARASTLRVPVAVAALLAAALHVPMTMPHLRAAPYMGIAFIAFMIATSVGALALLDHDRRRHYGVLGALCGAAIVTFVVTRLVALPQLGDDVGRWTESTAVAALLSEATVVVLATMAWFGVGARTTRRRWITASGLSASALSIAIGIPAVVTGAGTTMAMAAAPSPGIDCGATAGPTPTVGAFTTPLAIPPKVDRRSSTTPVKLYMRAGTHSFSPDLPATPTFGYSLTSSGADVYGGPTIEASRDVPLKLSVSNQLGTHPLANYIDPEVMGTQATDAAAPRGTVHLHGAHSEAKMDGLPDSTFGVGKAFTYTYGNDQDATGLWYHDHAWGLTRLQVTAGLAGQYWLRDSYDTGSDDNPLGLPSGAYEVPLTLQDRTFNANGTFAYPIGPHCGIAGLPTGYPNQWSPESFGDIATVNGKIEPNLDVNRGVYRFRLLNGSNARFYNLRLEQVDAAGNRTGTTTPFSEIGTDGGLLNAPVAMTELRVAPAERADLLIDFSTLPAGSRWRFVNDALAPYPGGGDADIAQIMQFTVKARPGRTLSIPTRLRGGRNRPALLPAVAGADDAGVLSATTLKAANRRTISLNEIADDITDPPTITGEPVHVMVNNLFFADAATMKPRTTQIETPKLNTVEEWDIVNTTGDAHPIHLHLTQFRLLNRQAIVTDVNGDTTYVTDGVNCSGANAVPDHCVPVPGLPSPSVAGMGPWPAVSPTPYLVGDTVAPNSNELGWKDTIVAMPGTVTRIVVPFGGTAAGIPAPFVGDRKNAAVQHFAGTYVFHCHILEHEDNDMMSPYKVTAG